MNKLNKEYFMNMIKKIKLIVLALFWLLQHNAISEESSAAITDVKAIKDVQDTAAAKNQVSVSGSPKTIAQNGSQNSLNIDHLKLARQFFKDGYFNLSLYHLMELAKTSPERLETLSPLIEKVLDKTGTLPLYVYPVEFLQKIKSSSIALHLAQLAFKAKNYQLALEQIDKVESNNSYYPEALLLQGTVRDFLNLPHALESFDQCVAESDKYAALVSHTKFKRYFIFIKEHCEINKARILYRSGNWNDAIAQYDLIDKNSYSWPYILLDKAWSYYKLKNYNRSLGIVMTYKSPLLENYFFPESELLQALSYYKLCLYNDAAYVIDKYYKVYDEKAKNLKAIINTEGNSDQYFFKLINEENSNDTRPFMKNLRAQLKKQLKIIIHLGSYKKAKEEYLRFLATKPNPVEKKFLETALQNMEKLLNQHTKEFVYFFLNSINYYSYEMFNIKLEIISRKKDLLYENKTLVANRARGSFSNISAGTFEYFFSFNGEFWADELGDYSMGLKSNCQTVLKKPEVTVPLVEPGESSHEVKK